MRPSSIIAILGAGVLVLSATLAYLIGYQRGSHATLSPAASELPCSERAAVEREAPPPIRLGSRSSGPFRPSDLPRATGSAVPVPAEAGDGAIEPTGQTLGGHERVASSRGVAGLLVAAGGESGIRFRTKPGTNNLVRIQGTSTIHDWEIRGRILLGSFEAGRDFGLDHSGMRRGRVDVRANLNIPVKSLRSVKQDGSPYSDAMDSTMHEKLLMESHPTIEFTLTELTRVESAEGEPLRFESRGNLAVAGVEREVEVPVSVVLAAESVHFSGELSMKMSDFGIEPPSIGDGTLVKIADEVALSVEWTLARITK